MRRLYVAHKAVVRRPVVNARVLRVRDAEQQQPAGELDAATTAGRWAGRSQADRVSRAMADTIR